jgi:hypothetical protein
MNGRSYTDVAQWDGAENSAVRHFAGRGRSSFRILHKADLDERNRLYVGLAVRHKADFAPFPPPQLSA